MITTPSTTSSIANLNTNTTTIDTNSIAIPTMDAISNTTTTYYYYN